MNPSSLFSVRITTGAGDARHMEIGLELLATNAAAWEEERGEDAVFDEYFISRGEAEDRLRKVEATLGEWMADRPWRARVCRVASEDWSELWKRFFKPRKVSDRLVIRPPWTPYEPVGEEIVVEIDPGPAFGTGLHPTTRACLAFLDDIGRRRGPCSFLDVGCGSGILAVAAVRLGFTRVTAIDRDATAVRVARETAERNGVSGQVTCRESDLVEFGPGEPFDVVAANLYADVLRERADRLDSCVGREEGSGLLIAGTLREQYEGVRDVYVEHGFTEDRHVAEEEWISGLLLRSHA
ncbi:MAG: 50S ribosomal protein L11 methyltransferase [Lentisphaerae bacterium]|nr:50S ribosomal protein L11 methyltransferase [Lentisphaerota bacterium]